MTIYLIYWTIWNIYITIAQWVFWCDLFFYFLIKNLSRWLLHEFICNNKKHFDIRAFCVRAYVCLIQICFTCIRQRLRSYNKRIVNGELYVMFKIDYKIHIIILGQNKTTEEICTIVNNLEYVRRSLCEYDDEHM